MPERVLQDGAECRIVAIGQRVLVPTDFSETSEAALAWAVAFANRCDASLHLLHVLEEIAGVAPLEWHVGVRSEIHRAIERAAWDDLRQLLSADDQARLHVHLSVEWGSPTVEILRYAKAHDVDLIAMGRHGKSGFPHVFRGSVAHEVMRSASCAVLSVRHPAIDRAEHRLRGRLVSAEP